MSSGSRRSTKSSVASSTGSTVPDEVVERDVEYDKLMEEIDAKLSITNIVANFQYEDEDEHDQEYAGEVEEDTLEPLKFFGTSEDGPFDEEQENIIRVLRKRNFNRENLANPPPEMIRKYFDLSLPEDRRQKLREQFPSLDTLSHFDRPYSSVEFQTLPDYQVLLPRIGQIRKMKRDMPTKAEFKKSVKIEMPTEEVVANPFFYPTDIPGYLQKEEEERLKKRQLNQNISVYEKLHGTALIQKEIMRRVKPYQAAALENAVKYDPVYDLTSWEAGRGLDITRIQKVSRKLHANYSKHRRDVFYAEYAIYARKRAIQEMLESEEAEEIALKNYEYLSSYATESLDIFLKESEEANNQASILADEKFKENLALSLETKELTDENTSLKTEIKELNDSLQECKFYMKFLDNVAHELMRRDEEDRYRMERREMQLMEDLANFLQQGMTIAEAEEALREKNAEFSDTEIGSKKAAGSHTESAEFLQQIQQEAEAQILTPPMATRIASIIKILATPMEPGEDGFSEQKLIAELNLAGGDDATDREELAGLVFTRPSQLLDLYADVEEHNLSLMQHAQVNEIELERLDRQILEYKKNAEFKSRHLRELILEIEAHMVKTTDQIDTLNRLMDMFTGGHYDVKSQEKLIRLLRAHVNNLYKACVGSNQMHLSSVMMLTSIEKSFEDLILDFESIPKEIVFQISHDLEKERREVERRDQDAARSQQRTDRSNKLLARAQEPYEPRKLRQIAFRSRPPRMAAKLEQKELDTKAEEDDMEYFFGE